MNHLFQAQTAYLDPAAVSTILATVSGIVISCSVVIGVFWRRITGFFAAFKLRRLEKKLRKQGERRANSVQK